MWAINETCEDHFDKRGKGSFVLNPDKIISDNPKAEYPLRWKGNVCGQEIILTQLTYPALSDDIVFDQYPEKYSYLKSSITEAINNYLRFTD